jgi:hypothetical protein
MKHIAYAAVSALVLASSVMAQPAIQSPTGNLERLLAMQSTGTEEPKPIPQEGRKADAIRRNLQRVKLPRFKIELYAVVPDARHMAVGPNAGVVFVGTRKSNAYAAARSSSGSGSSPAPRRLAVQAGSAASGAPFTATR